MRTIDEIIIHCSATKEGINFNVNDIRRWHKAKGWKDVGYHYVICLDGTIQEGRPIDEIGAHCSGHNSNSIGICYIGGLDENNNPKDTRTIRQKAALHVLLKQLCVQFPKATIHGHNEFSSKQCPCFDVKDEYGAYNEMIKLKYFTNEQES